MHMVLHCNNSGLVLFLRLEWGHAKFVDCSLWVHFLMIMARLVAWSEILDA
jgi:hypothetical protein